MDYQIHTLEELARAQSTLTQQVFAWVEGLQSERDHEYGPDTLNWLKDHLSRQEPDGLYQTFVFTTKENGTTKIAGTITVCDEDRAGGEVFEKAYDRKPDAFIGFAQIDYNVRGSLGLPSLMFEKTLQHLESFVNQNGEPKEVVFFSDRKSVQQFGQRNGFISGGLFVETDQGDGKIKREEIFVKRFELKPQYVNIPQNGGNFVGHHL